LLDFGVAKLLAPGADPGLTSTLYGVGPLTPEYASPEQVRGMPVTTATDVYALGAILYELLTGERAQKIDSRTPTQIDRVVCEIEPPPPSLIAQGLNSDLDNIVLMAMRKEPERRYASVDQLADDIRRYLDGRPVVARKDSLTYRAGKFVRRNRLAIAAAVLVFGALVAGVAISLHQARQAIAARSLTEAQRRTADRERARAEAEALVARTEEERSARRLTQMVELADRSLYDVHSAVEKLPGSTEARRQIVATTLQFLENLSKDAGEDDSLRLVLSAAYMKAADVQGNPMRANLGDSQSALANYRKSVALVEPLLAKGPDRLEYLMQWIDVQTRLAYLLDSLGQPQEATNLGRMALPAAEKLVRLCSAKLDCLRTEADLYDALTFTLRDRDASAALGYSNEQIHSLQQILKLFPTNDAAALDLATAYSQAAVIRNRRGELRDAVDLYHRAIDLRERAIAHNPADAGTRRLVMITYGNLAGTLGSPFYLNLGDTPGALENYTRALAIARELAKADADNQLAQYDLANALLLTASLDLPEDRWAASLAMLQEADAILQKLVAADPQSVTKLRRLAMAQEYEGRRLQALGNRTQAVAYYRQSLAIAEKALAHNPSDGNLTSQALADEEALAAALALDGNRAGAVEIAQKAVARAERVSSAPGSEMDIAIRHRAEAYHELGAVYAAFSEWKDARAAAERAVSAWRQLANAGSKMVVPAEADQAEGLLRNASARLP
jgi:tetratricopeptide (TPR) repeat protein